MPSTDYTITLGNTEYDVTLATTTFSIIKGDTGDAGTGNIHAATDIGAALADNDELGVYDTSATAARKSALSRLWTWVAGKLAGVDTKATPVDADSISIIDSAASNAPKRLLWSALWTWVQAKLAGASTKATPVDADSIPLVDSAASNAAKRVLWSKIQAGTSAATLPTGGDIVTGQIVRLTAADGTALAPPGLYVHDGTGWLCLAYTAAYALGNLGATPSHTLIAGAEYTATVDQEITSWTLTMSRVGHVGLTLTNAGTAAVAQPTMAGRTQKLLETGAWDGAATALSLAVVEDDGTYLIAASSEMA